MTQIRVVNPVQTDFTMLPNIVWRWPGLSFRAKAFLAYLLSFHGGVCPPVAAMEAETGLGRDARRACMAELQAAGLSTWVVERDRSGRVVAKFLEVTTLPLLAAQVREAETRATAVAAKRAAAAGQGPRRHAPEKPSDGFSGGCSRDFRRSRPESQAILKIDEDEDSAAPSERARSPRKSGARAPGRARQGSETAVALADLGRFSRTTLREGRDCVLPDGRTLRAGSAEWAQLADALRSEERGRH